MVRKIISGILFGLLLVSMFTTAFSIQGRSVKASTLLSNSSLITGDSNALVPLLDTFVTVMEPSTLGWDRGIGTPYVMYDAGLYKMWYWAFDNPGGFGRRAIAYAESNDGITWFNKQMVHDAGSGYYVTMSPWVLKEDGIYRMWHADYWEWIDGDWSFYIAHMSSTDGINWPAFMSAGDQEVLSAQGQTNPQGDGYDIWHACVIHEPSGYVMWYTVNDHPQPGVSGPSKIWRATSTDGITWSNRQLSLPYIPDTWEGSIGHASVVKEDDGTYTMFYAAGGVGGSSIGMAQSSDGTSWVSRTQLLKSSDLGTNITSIGDPFCFTDVNGDRYLYFTYYYGGYKLGRIQLGARPPLSASITPVSASIYLGQSVTFTSTTSGGISPYSYQWYLNGSAVSGVTASNWTFTMLPMGNYSVCLTVTDSLGSTGESNQASLTVVHLLGDVNNDGRVDMKDIGIAARAFGTVQGDARWNPAADVNHDGKVDMKDIAVIAKNFGQHYP